MGGGVFICCDVVSYNRKQAIRYAHRWAFGRNPEYYNYNSLGGDCTNFASQCLYAGAHIMNDTPDFGWYYIDANNKAPAWTGVEFFYRFLTRAEKTPGPYAVQCRLNDVLPGDFVQLKFDRKQYGHTPIIVSTGWPRTLRNTLVAAHSYDTDFRPLSTYPFQEIRFLHIEGAYSAPVNDPVPQSNNRGERGRGEVPPY